MVAIMRVAVHLVEKRREELAHLLSKERYLPLAEICKRFSISEATARRDLAHLESSKKIQRTFGGAVSFFNARFPSFEQRLQENERAKRKIARLAALRISPGMKCFFDSGTTAYLVAQELLKLPVRPLTIVTANLPVAELMAESDGLDVHLTGGQLVVRQSVLLGPASRDALRQWEFDAAILSAEGMNREGLWNSQEEIILTQREVMSRTQKCFAILHRKKLGVTTPHFLCEWVPKLHLFTDAAAEELAAHGIPNPFAQAGFF